MTCPGCNSHTSEVLSRVTDGEPCPRCGLSADAILEITDIRRKQADRELAERLEKAVLDSARFEAEASGLRQKLQDVRDAIGCTCR